MPSNQALPFLIANRQYFETLDQYQASGSDFHDHVAAELPRDWTIQRSGAWYSCRPAKHEGPRQGWKIHVSAAEQYARAALDASVKILVARATPFKFALDVNILSAMNGKNWSRGGAGKFITVYPSDDTSFRTLCNALKEATAGLSGPYILSDRRLADSKCIFYRYGGFVQMRRLRLEGDFASCIEDPSGNWIADERRPQFSAPVWVQDPFEETREPEEHGDALCDGRFEVTAALAFSNSGGVYLATDRVTEDVVVIKEARPFVGSGADGYDAVMSLEKEHRLLSRLSHTGVAAKPVAFFEDWEHAFLAQERLDGEALSDYSARTSIVLATNPTEAQRNEYSRSYRDLMLRLVDVVELLHDHNIVFGDLSPHNIIVPEDLATTKLIDFEGAVEIDGDARTRIATPGYAAPEQRTGRAQKESDIFALGAIGSALLFPVNAMCEIVPAARGTFVDAVVSDVGLPSELTTLLGRMTAVEPSARPTLSVVRASLESCDWSVRPREERRASRELAAKLRDGALASIEATWTPERQDRLVPCDAKGFTTNALSIAHGACGVARAFRYVTGHVPEPLRRYIRDAKLSVKAFPPGLYFGLAGIAWTLADIGEHGAAREAIMLSREHPLRHTGHSVWHGEAGVGLAALRLFDELDETWLADLAFDCGRYLLDSAVSEAGELSWANGDVVPHGFAHGASGVAELFRRLATVRGEAEWLEHARRALQFDLGRAVTTRDDGWSWTYVADKVSAVLPYFEYGSAGIGAVVARMYATTGEAPLLGVLQRIRNDTARRFALQPGLAMGLSGLAEVLMDCHEATGAASWMEDAELPIYGACLFGSEGAGGVVFPGDRLQRLSCDYLTGSAGIAITLHRWLTGGKRDLLG